MATIVGQPSLYGCRCADSRSGGGDRHGSDQRAGRGIAVLSDILGLEDHLGDMDFKVARTPTGVTGFQLDVKIGGVNTTILRGAIEESRQGRLWILEKMASVIAMPAHNYPHMRRALSPSASTRIRSARLSALVGKSSVASLRKPVRASTSKTMVASTSRQPMRRRRGRPSRSFAALRRRLRSVRSIAAK